MPDSVGLRTDHVDPYNGGLSPRAARTAPATPLIVPMAPVTAPKTDNQEASSIAASIRSALPSPPAVDTQSRRIPAARLPTDLTSPSPTIKGGLVFVPRRTRHGTVCSARKLPVSWPRRGLSLSVHVAREPITKRATSFFDGQNLFWHAKTAFGYEHPNYDPSLLSVAVCRANGWRSLGVRFYTGVPTADRDPRWHGYWQRRLLSMRRAGIHVESRPFGTARGRSVYRTEHATRST